MLNSFIVGYHIRIVCPYVRHTSAERRVDPRYLSACPSIIPFEPSLHLQPISRYNAMTYDIFLHFIKLWHYFTRFIDCYSLL